MLVAWGRKVGNGSALSAACGSSRLADRAMSRQIVIRWEHAVATSIAAGMAKIHAQHEHYFREAKDCFAVCFVVVLSFQSHYGDCMFEIYIGVFGIYADVCET